MRTAARIGTAWMEVDADLSPLNRKLNELRARGAQIKITADIDRSSFARATATSGLLGGTEEVKLKADVDTRSFARASAVQAVLTKESSKLGDVFNRSNLSIGQWTGLLAASLPVVVDLGGALGALTASASAAAAGLGALAVGGAAAGAVGLSGFAAIAVPAIARLKDLKTAQDAYTAAVQQYGRHSTQARTAFSKLQVEQKKAGPAATKFAGSLSAISRRWKDLTEAGQRDFFGMLSDGLDRLGDKLPLFAKSANSSMRALREGFDRFLDKATGPGFNKFISVMTRTFANSMGPISDAFGNIAIVLQRLAIAVAPDIVRMVKGFKEMTRGWADSTRNAGALRDTVHGLVNQANTWWKLLKAVGGLFAAVLVPGMGKGKRAVEGITASIKEWTDWVNAHPREMRDFFKEGLETTRRLAEVLLGFLPSLFEISTAMRPIARAFLGILRGLNSLKIGNVSALTVLLGAMVGAKLIGGLRTAIGLFNALKVAALGAAAAETAAGSAGAFGGAKGVAGAAGVGSRFGLAFATAWAVPVTATIAATFTEGGLLDTIKGRGSATAGAVLGGKIGQAMTARFDAVTKKLPELSIHNLRRKREQLVSTAKTLGELEGAGIGDGMVKGLRQKADRLKGAIDAQVAALRFGEKFAGAIARSKKPVGAATKGLLDKFQNLNNASRRTFFNSVHRYVDSMVRSGQISRKQGDRIENYWRGVRRREAKAWDKFIGDIVSGFRGIVSDLERVGNLARGGKKEQRQAVQTVKDWLTPDKGKAGGQAGGLVTPEGIMPLGFQAGGLVGRRGRPPGPRDTVPAMLEPGELVIPKKLVDQTRVKAKLTAVAMTEELDKGYKESRKSSDEFVKDHGKKLEKLRSVASTLTGRFRKSTITDFEVTGKRGADLAERLRGNVSQDFDRMRQGTTRDTERMRGNVTDGMNRMREKSVQSSQKMEKGVGGNFRDMSNAVGDGLSMIAKMTNKALKALGVKAVDFGVGVKKQKGGPVKAQRGGHITAQGVPATGDHIPALLEKNEYVVNSKASKKHRALLNKLNFEDAPRFQKGGAASGGMAAMIARANEFERHAFPYLWGGGHGSFGMQPVDCSGAVSDVLHTAGLLNAPLTSGGLMSWGKPGKGPLTVYANPIHVVMSLNGRTFGTSGTNPGDGAGWIDGASGEGLAPGAVRTMDVVGGIAEQVKKLVFKGTEPLRSAGQAIMDQTRSAANKLIERKTPSGAFGGGQALQEMFKGGREVTASWYGPIAGQGPHPVGAGGVPMRGNMFAELNMGTALGHLPFGGKMQVGYKGHSAVGEKQDIGAGGGGLGGAVRAIDLWTEYADLFPGLKAAGIANVMVKKAQRGGFVGMQKGGNAEKKGTTDMSIRRLLGISRRGKGDDDQKALDELLSRIHEEEKGAPVKPQGQLHDWMEKLELLELKHRFHPKAKVNQRRLNVFVRQHAKKMIHQLHRRGEKYKSLRERLQIAKHTPGTKDDERIQNRIDEFLGEGGGMLGKIHEAQKGVPIKPFGHLFKYLEELKVLELKRSLHPGSKDAKRDLKDFLKEEGKYILGALKFRKKEWAELQIKKQIAAHTPDKKDDERIARLIEKFLGKKPGATAGDSDAAGITQSFFDFLKLVGPGGAPFGGSFAKGGQIPGPPGAPRTVVAHGGEVIGPAGPSVLYADIYIGGEKIAEHVETELRAAERKERLAARTSVGRLQ